MEERESGGRRGRGRTEEPGEFQGLLAREAGEPDVSYVKIDWFQLLWSGGERANRSRCLGCTYSIEVGLGPETTGTLIIEGEREREEAEEKPGIIPKLANEGTVTSVSPFPVLLNDLCIDTHAAFPKIRPPPRAVSILLPHSQSTGLLSCNLLSSLVEDGGVDWLVRER